MRSVIRRQTFSSQRAPTQVISLPLLNNQSPVLDYHPSRQHFYILCTVSGGHSCRKIFIFLSVYLFISLYIYISYSVRAASLPSTQARGQFPALRFAVAEWREQGSWSLGDLGLRYDTGATTLLLSWACKEADKGGSNGAILACGRSLATEDG